MATDPWHLGGYWPGGDPYSWTPTLWAWLVAEHGVESVIDVGCGEGQALLEFQRLGAAALGVDGLDVADGPLIEVHDYTTGPFVPSRRYDLAWSCEFVEHVEERYRANFIETFKAADLLLMTHGTPGQKGHHHVNCQWGHYWVELLAADGWRYDADLTAEARRLARLDEPLAYFATTGMALWR